MWRSGAGATNPQRTLQKRVGARNQMGGLLGDTVCVTTSMSGSDDKNITGDYY